MTSRGQTPYPISTIFNRLSEGTIDYMMTGNEEAALKTVGAGLLTDRKTDRQTHRQTDRQTDRKTDRQTHRETETETDSRWRVCHLSYTGSLVSSTMYEGYHRFFFWFES